MTMLCWLLATCRISIIIYDLSGPHLHSEDDDGSGGIGELLIDADSPVSRIDHKGLLVVVGGNILQPCSTLIPENKFSLSQ